MKDGLEKRLGEVADDDEHNDANQVKEQLPSAILLSKIAPVILHDIIPPGLLSQRPGTQNAG
jgi:hypothetical protein